MRTTFENDNDTVARGYSKAEGARWQHEFGDSSFDVQAVGTVATKEVSRLAPAVEDWDHTLFARDIANQAAVKAGVTVELL